jgi:hypothetical protein
VNPEVPNTEVQLSSLHMYVVHMRVCVCQHQSINQNPHTDTDTDISGKFLGKEFKGKRSVVVILTKGISS